MSNGSPLKRHTTISGNGGSARIAAALTLLIFLGLEGCSRSYTRFLKLPADPSVESSLGWVAVSSAYAPLKERPDMLSAEISVLRGGTIFKPAARVIDAQGMETGGLWYEYGDGSVKGWIRSSDTASFSSAEQARNYVSGMRDK